MNKPNSSEKIAAEVKTRNESKFASIFASKTASNAFVSRATSSATIRLLTPTFACAIRSPNPDLVKKKSMIKNRCFNCNEVDHIAKECTKSKMMKMNEIKEINNDEKESKKE